MIKIEKEEGFIPKDGYKDISYESIVYDLNRIELLNDTINELINCCNNLDFSAKKDNVILNFEITKLANKKNFSTDENLQALALELQEKLSIKRELFIKRYEYLQKQIKDFRKSYYELFAKEVNINCASLIKQLEKNLNKKLYYNLYLDVVYPYHLSLNKIIKRLKNKTTNLNLTISDNKNLKESKENTEIFYSKSFPINLEKMQAKGVDLSLYIIPEYKTTLDGKKYTYLKVRDIYNTNLDFKLGDLIKESEEWKPVELIRNAVLDYKQSEKEKIKKFNILCK